jgi:hypothetical protein
VTAIENLVAKFEVLPGVIDEDDALAFFCVDIRTSINLANAKVVQKLFEFIKPHEVVKLGL